MTATNKKRGVAVHHRARVTGSPLRGRGVSSSYGRSSGFGGRPVRAFRGMALSSLRASSGPNGSGSISAFLADDTNLNATFDAFLVPRGFSVCMATALTLTGLTAPGTNTGRAPCCDLVPHPSSHSLAATRTNSRHGAQIEYTLLKEDQAYLPPLLEEARFTIGQTFTSLGVCVLSHSANTAFMRVCQPGPEALNCSSTSGSKRTLTCSLVVSDFGRPRFGWSISFAWALPNNPGSTSRAGLALAKSLADHSGLVVSTFSGLSFLVIAFDLPFVGFTKTDDVNRVTPRGEHHDMQPITYETHRLIPAFSVVESVVLNDQSRGPIEVAHQGEWESTFFNVACVFGWVVGNLHVFIVPTINALDNSQAFPSLVMPSHSRYGLHVAANSATGPDNPTTQRPHLRPISIGGAFFTPAKSFYGGCAWETFGSAGGLCARFISPRTAATHSPDNERGSSPHKGAVPLPTLNPSALRALAHRRMSLERPPRRFIPLSSPQTLQRPHDGHRPHSGMFGGDPWITPPTLPCKSPTTP